MGWRFQTHGRYREKPHRRQEKDMFPMGNIGQSVKAEELNSPVVCHMTNTKVKWRA